MTLRLGSRGSALALAQAGLVRDRIKALHPGLDVEIIPIKTTGDRLAETPLSQISGKGIFIKEIEEALRDNRVDLAVHSLKDLPADLPPGFELAAILEREDPRDCLISRFGEQLGELPRGARVGTGSLRRQAQIRAYNKKVRVEDVRGNLDTRLRKVQAGEWDSIVVALAGVRRLGKQEEVSEILPFDVMLPAPGQGFLAVEIRAGDNVLRDRVKGLDDGPGHRAADAERAFLAALGGGCRVPIAAHARVEKETISLEGLVISPDGKEAARGKISGEAARAAALGTELGKKLLAEGAGKILASVVP